MGDSLNPFGLMFSSVLKIDIGVITVWSGGLGNIPPGWHLCDGSPGTPDLRNKFVVSAGPTFSVGDEDGASTHSHDFTANGHDHFVTGPTATVPGVGASLGSDTTQLSGTTDVQPTKPPYYALAYIIFLGD